MPWARPATPASANVAMPAPSCLQDLPDGDVVLVIHSGTVRAILAIALDLSPDAGLRFVTDPLSLTRVYRLLQGWRVCAINIV